VSKLRLQATKKCLEFVKTSNNKMDLKYYGREKRIPPHLDKYKLRAVVNTVMDSQAK